MATLIGEHNGYLHLSDEVHKNARRVHQTIAKNARVFLEYGVQRDGYFTGDRFLEEMKNACDIAEVKIHPQRTRLSSF